jgi:hypothetical protein
MPGIEVQQRFVEAEHLVEAHSGELKKELRLIDLVLSQALYIVGIQWLGTAGKLGSAHVMYWIPAVRRWGAGGISVPQQRRYYLLGTHIRCDVRDTSGGARREASDYGPDSRCLGPRNDPRICGAVDIPGRGREKLSVIYH